MTTRLALSVRPVRPFLAVAFALASAALSATEFKLEQSGKVVCSEAGLELSLSAPLAGWKGPAAPLNRAYALPDAKRGRLAWDLAIQNVDYGRGVTTFAAASNRTARIAFDLTASKDEKLEGLYSTLHIPAARYAGCAWRIDRAKAKPLAGRFPAAGAPISKNISLAGVRDAVAFVLALGDGREMTLRFDAPTTLRLQDSRRWGDSHSLRIGYLSDRLEKGKKYRIAYTLAASDGVTVDCDRAYTIEEGPEWLTLDYKKDILADSALDFSHMNLWDAPAGKHGWLKNVDGHFEFEKLPGVPQRFYGVNLCFNANYPTHEETDMLVTRLVRLGYNSIRIHHFERDLVDPKDRMTLREDRIDRLDYLVAKAIERGIYFTTDLYVSRPVLGADIGLDALGKGLIENKNAYKVLVAMYEPAFENYKRFCRNLLLHVNKYTGRRYADEPALPLISLINEGQITMGWSRKGCPANAIEPVAQHYADWLAARRAADPLFCPDAATNATAAAPYRANGAAFALYMADVERRNATRIIAFLRDELKCRALFTDANCGPHFAPMQYVREEVYDYVDDHFYVDHPHFLVNKWSLPSGCGNVNPVRMERLPPVNIAFTRTSAQPFCVTEWNFSGPGEFRGVGGIMTGALSALQDWSGLWRFAYAHGIADIHDGHGLPGYFNVATDPLGQAGDRASILLFLRRDLAPLEGKVALLVTPEALREREGGKPVACAPAWRNGAWYRQVSTTTDAKRARPGSQIVKLAETFSATNAPFECVGSKAIAIDRDRGSFVIDTLRTAGGFTVDEKPIVSSTVSFTATGGPATVWASSHDGEPIRSSRRLLVTHLTDVQAAGNVYASKEKKVLMKWGRKGILVRKGTAKVALALDAPDAYRVWALETSGRRLASVRTSVEDGKLVFTADVALLPKATMLYEIERKE